MATPKHIPVRSCAACGQRFSKRDVTRIVRSAEGNIEVDNTGKQPGRGSYLCSSEECWQNGLKKRRIDHALRSPLLERDREGLMAYYNDAERAAQ